MIIAAAAPALRSNAEEFATDEVSATTENACPWAPSQGKENPVENR